MTDHRLLTVRQPWAKAIVDGKKTVENRTSAFGTSYRGPLWIHAAGRWSDQGLVDDRIAIDYPAAVLGAHGFRGAGFILGAVLGRVHVVDAHHRAPECCPTWYAEDTFVDAGGKVRTDPVHLVLANPVALELADTIEAPGALGIWRADRVPGLEAELDHVLEEGYHDLLERLEEREFGARP